MSRFLLRWFHLALVGDSWWGRLVRWAPLAALMFNFPNPSTEQLNLAVEYAGSVLYDGAVPLWGAVLALLAVAWILFTGGMALAQGRGPILQLAFDERRYPSCVQRDISQQTGQELSRRYRVYVKNWGEDAHDLKVKLLRFTPIGARFLPTELRCMNDREPYTRSLHGLTIRRGEEEYFDLILAMTAQDQFYWKYARPDLPTPSPMGNYTFTVGAFVDGMIRPTTLTLLVRANPRGLPDVCRARGALPTWLSAVMERVAARARPV